MNPSRLLARPACAAITAFLCCFAASSRAQTPFATTDKGFSFTLPAGWRASEEGGRIHVTGPDGASYLISRDAVPAPAGDPANSPPLRAAAEGMLKPVITSPEYAGVRPVKVAAGAGAAYRFRGRGSKSGTDLAEVWFAVIGKHTVALLPDRAPEPDHAYELSTLFESLAFADSPSTGANLGGRRAGGAGKGAGGAGTNAARPVALDSGSRAALTSTTTEMERYEGHLLGTDAGFTLYLNHDGSASLDWASALGMAARFTGTYTGSDGNYAVTLNRATGTNRLHAKGMTLALQGVGGMESGQFATDLSPAKRDIADIKLTSVDAGKITLHGSKAGANQAAGRRNTANRSTGRGRRAMNRSLRRSLGGVRIYGNP